VHFEPIFCQQKISNPKHSFVIFAAKILYKKCSREMLMPLTPTPVQAARKMLVKLAPDQLQSISSMLNAQIFCTKVVFRQLFSGYMYVEKAAKTTFVRKICT